MLRWGLVIGSLLFGQVALAKSTPVLAVFAIEDTRSKKERLSKAKTENLTTYLSTLLGQGGAFKIVPTGALQEALRGTKKESYQACYDEGCQIEIGKAVSAEKTLSARIMRVGKACVVTANLYDLREEATEDSSSRRAACTEQAIVGALEDVATALRNGKGRPTPKRATKIRFDAPSLPTVPSVDAPSRLQSQTVGLDFESIDVEAMAVYDQAVTLEKDDDATPQAKLAGWKKVVADAPAFREVGRARVAAWTKFIADKKAAERAREQYEAKRKKDYDKLARLLGMGVVSDKDKGEWAIAYADAYGWTKKKNPKVATSTLKPWLKRGLEARADDASLGWQDRLFALDRLQRSRIFPSKTRQAAYARAGKLAGDSVPVDFSLPVDTFTLDNGLEVRVGVLPAPRKTSVYLATRCGLDVQDRPGVAVLTQHALLKGTGMSNGAVGAHAATLWHHALEVGEAEAVVQRLGARLGSLGLDPSAVEEARAKAVKTSNWEWISDPLEAAFYIGASARRRQAKGTKQQFGAIPAADVIAFARACYRPDNALLVVSGPFDAGKMGRLVRTHLSGWAPAGPPAPKRSEPTRTLRRSKLLLRTYTANAKTQKPLAQILMRFAGPGTTTDPEATYVADVLSYMAQSKAAPFWRAMGGRASYVRYSTLDDTGPLSVHTWVPIGDIVEGVRSLQRALRDMERPDSYPNDLLETAQGSLAFRQWSDATTHDGIAWWWALPGGLRYAETYPAKVRAVRAADVGPLLRRYVYGRPFVLQVRMPKGTKLTSSARSALEGLLQPVRPSSE